MNFYWPLALSSAIFSVAYIAKSLKPLFKNVDANVLVSIISIIVTMSIGVSALRIDTRNSEILKEEQRQKRIDYTFSIFARYQSGKVSLAREALVKAFSYSEIETKITSHPNEVDDIWKEHVLHTIQEETLHSSVDELVIFYREVYICIESSHCEKKIADQFFSDDINSFYYLLFPYIQDVREHVNIKYAIEVENYVKENFYLHLD